MQISPMFFTIQGISQLAAPEVMGVHKDDDPYFRDVIRHRIDFLNTENFNIHFFTSLTNLRLILVTSPRLTNVKPIFSDIYKAYADFVIKDPNFTVRFLTRF